MEKKDILNIRIESMGLIFGVELCEIIISKRGYMDALIPVFGHDFEDVLYISELVRDSVKNMTPLTKKRPDN